MRAPPRWAGFAPALGRIWRKRLVALACQLGSAEGGMERQTRIRDAHEAFRTAGSRQPSLHAEAAAQVLVDLARQGWGIRVRGQRIEVRAPDSARGLAEKERIRVQELMKRDEQLTKPTVRAFIEQMERRRSYAGQEVSIMSLMRDGRDLACELGAARDKDDPVGAASAVVRPYLQFAGASDRCEHTGHRLADIWRYFRSTWANQATSTPGRTVRFLVRDAGSQYHPVMGIGALGSPVAQLRDRDEWIGWDADGFLRRLRALGAPSDTRLGHARAGDRARRNPHRRPRRGRHPVRCDASVPCARNGVGAVAGGGPAVAHPQGVGSAWRACASSEYE